MSNKRYALSEKLDAIECDNYHEFSKRQPHIKRQNWKDQRHIMKRSGVTRDDILDQIEQEERRQAEDDATPTLEETYSAGREQLTETLEELRSLNRWARLAFFGDLHEPYVDETAFRLALQIMRDYRPDITPDFNDLMDLSAFSTFEDKRPLNKRLDSNLRTRLVHHRTINGLVMQTNQAQKRIAIPGNHDMRLDNLWLSHPQATGYTLDKFYHDISKTGTILTGDNEVELSPGLAMKHGDRAQKVGATTARDMLYDMASKRALVAAHVHRAGSFYQTGKYGTAQAHVVGCLCINPPHYAKNGKFQNWQQGLALVDFDPNGEGVHVQNLVFVRDGTRLRAWVGGKPYIQKDVG
jgi:hypothetical protein